MDEGTPVSYTHLDVYKRQVQSGPTLEISDETLTEGTSDTIRFGRLHSGETGIKRFRLQNTSSRTWVVTRYEVSCECVTPVFDRRPLKPGEEIPFSCLLYTSKATQINDSGRIDIRRQSGKNHYKQQPESSSILSSFYPIQS